MVQRCPDDDDYCAFTQSGIARLVWDDEGTQQHLEIPVSRPTDEFLSPESRTLAIPRPATVVRNDQVIDLRELPVLPLSLHSNCNRGYLNNRGQKLESLLRSQVVEYEEDELDETVRTLD